MSRKKADGKAPPVQVIEFSKLPGECERDAIGRNVIRPEIGGAMTIKTFGGKHALDVEIMGLVTALSSKAKGVTAGDLKAAESMLVVQANTLDALFNTLAQRAALNMGEYLPAAETYLRLALKAQSQCRATLETLANMKNPPAIYARQANLTTGPQQINNDSNHYARAREGRIEQSKLSHGDDSYGLRQDIGAPALAGGTDPAMEAVGEVHGTADTGGKG
ncbi:MAG: hypothetical protein K2X67_13040 [Burkholderiales bacterium]|nr:hypothetical protein [Burkholderiales bacterium]